MSDTAYALDAAPLDLPAAALPERCDVFIVGGGYAGLSAALHLARAGRTVALADQGALGEGASGRNGGQVHIGQRQGAAWLAATLGRETADQMWALADAAEAHLHTLRAELGADCDFKPGVIYAAHNAAALAERQDEADRLADWYDVPWMRLDREALAAAISSPRFIGGVRTPRGGHLNPLKFSRALARGAAAAGAVLVPHAKVTALDGKGPRTVHVAGHTVHADTVILAGNGMMAGLCVQTDQRIVPLRNYISATVRLPERLIPGGEAVADTRFVIRYWREDEAGRLVFGGGENFGQSPTDIAGFVRPYLTEIYPHLADTEIEAAWGGTLGITQTRCPLVRRLSPGLYVAAGFSGQGVALAPFAGKMVADAVLGDTAMLDVFAKMAVPPLPGGRLLKTPLVALAMTWFALRDRLGV